MNLRSRCLFNVFLSFLLFAPSCLLAYIVFCILNPCTPCPPFPQPLLLPVGFLWSPDNFTSTPMSCMCACMCEGGGDLCIYIKSGNHKWDKQFLPLFFHLFFRILLTANFLNFFWEFYTRKLLHHFCPSVFLLPPTPPVSSSLHLKFMSSFFLIIITYYINMCSYVYVIRADHFGTE